MKLKSSHLLLSKEVFTLLILLCIYRTLTVSAAVPPGYYSAATGAGAILKTQLHNIISGHTAKSYDYLWTAFATTDVRNDVVYAIQSNCNTFIDHPEYVHQIWVVEKMEQQEPLPEIRVGKALGSGSTLDFGTHIRGAHSGTFTIVGGGLSPSYSIALTDKK